MKKLIISLLSALTVTLSGFALAGATPVQAPEPAPVVEVAPPVVAEPVVEVAPVVVEVAKPAEEPAATCEPSDQNKCATDDKAEEEETPVQDAAS